MDGLFGFSADEPKRVFKEPDFRDLLLYNKILLKPKHL